MRLAIRRFFMRILFLSCFAAIVLFGVAYRIFSKVTNRVFYEKRIKEKMESVRSRLKKMYNASEVRFTTDDGLVIAGMLVVRENAQRNVIICHGYMGSKERMASFIDMFPRDNVLLFDFRAHGESEGNFISIGYREQADVCAAVQFLQSNAQTKGLSICGLGISMGAASLIRAASEGAPFDALVLDSSFARLNDHVGESFAIRTGLPRFPFLSIMSYMFRWTSGFSIADVNPCDQIKKVACPVFVIHAKDDEVIAVYHAHEIYNNAGSKKKLWLVDSKRHGYACSDCKEHYVRLANEFFASAAA